jgi:hypothetical protein
MDDVTKRFDWFRDDGIFAPMLNDAGRNRFYQTAIEHSAPGKIVADVGAGTGLLSVMACAAGARHVYAIEKHPDRAVYLAQVIDQLGLRDQVTVVADDFVNTDIRADIYVSETINTQIFGEDMHVLSNHAQRHGGVWIPSYFDIWPVIYDYHPIFILDQSHSDSSVIDTHVSVSPEYTAKINQDFQSPHPKNTTLYTANQLNKLFTLLPSFTDIKLTELWRGAPLRVDMNQPVDVNNIRITVPAQHIPASNAICHLVLFWRAGFGDIVMNSSDVWFGNVTKTIEARDRTPGADIETWYDNYVRNWRVTY